VELFLLIYKINNDDNDNNSYSRFIFNMLTQQPKANSRQSKEILEKMHEIANHKHQHIKNNRK
jgi:hypothetical protein